jgi:hypothetical protein
VDLAAKFVETGAIVLLRLEALVGVDLGCEALTSTAVSEVMMITRMTIEMRSSMIVNPPSPAARVRARSDRRPLAMGPGRLPIGGAARSLETRSGC